MFTIHLNNLQFHAFHGLYPEERILGNDFVVNVAMELDTEGRISRLEQTVNYEKAYQAIAERMNKPALLLETLAQDLADDIQATDGRIVSISISIEKKYPPLNAIQGSVGVTYKKVY